MPRKESGGDRLPRGVTVLPRSRAGRRYRATIRRGKGVEVHLGLYTSAWLAGFAYEVAAQAIGRGGGGRLEIPAVEQPSADQVRLITARVRCRLGLEEPPPPPDDRPPAADQLLALFEVTIVGFWRDQAALPGADGRPGAGLEASARRLVEAAHLLFWCRSCGQPTPLEVLTSLLVARLDRTFRRADLAREVLDDDGDDEWLIALWLVHPDALPGGLGFRQEVIRLYPDFFRPDPAGLDPSSSPAWATVLGIHPPFSSDQIRRAYRSKSRAAHPDAGGSPSDFIRLRSAFEEARRYCLAMGL